MRERTYPRRKNSEKPLTATLRLRTMKPAIIISLLLCVATAIPYSQARYFSFVNYDDPEYVTENPHVRSGLTPHSIAWSFNVGYAANWHPLTWLSHMLDCTMFGMDPGAHHMTNLLFHILNTLLLFFYPNGHDRSAVEKRLRCRFICTAPHACRVGRMDRRTERRPQHLLLDAYHGGIPPVCETRHAGPLPTGHALFHPGAHGQTHAGHPSAGALVA